MRRCTDALYLPTLTLRGGDHGGGGPASADLIWPKVYGGEMGIYKRYRVGANCTKYDTKMRSLGEHHSHILRGGDCVQAMTSEQVSHKVDTTANLNITIGVRTDFCLF